ncbi:MAG TPA: MazG nucleotide pyrophosphohydrolase domain-containing protein, partial [Blastocatellia bacterium]
EAIKADELAAKGKGAETGGSMLDSVSTRLPAVMEAFQISTKVARVNFDWPDVASVLEKLDEEVEELKQAVASDTPRHRDMADEVGDLLLVAVNVARLLGIDPESALKSSNRKFRRRFRHIEDRLREQGRKPADSNDIEMDALWNEAKEKEKGRTAPDARPGAV